MRYRKGTILKVFRGFYFHFGVYAGAGKVIHFTSNGENEMDADSADVMETSYERFAKGDVVQVDNGEEATFEPEEIVRRAKAAVGTMRGRYNLIHNNCEHFANWCRCGNPVSHQKIFVENFLSVLTSGSSFWQGVQEAFFQNPSGSVNRFYESANNKLVKKS